MPPKKKRSSEAQAKAKAKRYRENRASLREEQLVHVRALNAVRQARRRANLTEEKLAQLRARDAQRHIQRRKNETSEQRRLRNSKNNAGRKLRVARARNATSNVARSSKSETVDATVDQVNSNCYKEEMQLEQASILEITLSVKEEILDYSLKASVSDMDNERCNLPIITESVRAAPDISDRYNVFRVKDEPGEAVLDFKPASHENADMDHTSDQNTSVAIDENEIAQDGNDPILLNRVKEERNEDECGGSRCRLYQCDLCGKMYDGMFTLKIHIERIHSTKSHECPDCDKVFKCASYLLTHGQNVHRTRQYECVVCERKCKSELALRDHVPGFHGDRSEEIQQDILDVSIKNFESNCSNDPIMYNGVKEESVENECGDMDEQRCVEATSPPAAASDMEVAASSVDEGDLAHIKEELGDADLDIGPTVILQNQPGSCPQLYSCDKCIKTFNSKAFLRGHCRRIHNKQALKCTKCNKEFKCKEYLQAHVRNMHSERQYECAVCKAMYKSKQALGDHIRSCHGDKSVGSHCQLSQCDLCQKMYKDKFTLKNHVLRMHATKSHKCTDCDKEFKCASYMLSHVRKMHRTRKYECAVCKTKCKSELALRNHVPRSHGHRSEEIQQDILDVSIKNFESNCSNDPIMYNGVKEESVEDECGDMDEQRCVEATSPPAAASDIEVAASSVDEGDLAHIKDEPDDADLDIGPTVLQHKEDLLQNKPGSHPQLYSCDKCIKTFNSKAFLRGHSRRVHNKQTHKCTKCNEEFSCKDYLQNHVCNVHSEQQYECAVCKAMYKSKQALGGHMKSHKFPGSQNWQLYQCDLKNHVQRIHATESHKCTDCDKEFKWASDMLNHVRNVHRTRQYECVLCETKCKSELALRDHVPGVHGHRSAEIQQDILNVSIKNFEWKMGGCQHEEHGTGSHPTADTMRAAAGTSTPMHKVVVVKEDLPDGKAELGTVVHEEKAQHD